MTDTLYEKWLAYDESLAKSVVVKSRYGRGWFAQRVGHSAQAFDDFEAAIAYATDADR